MMAAEFMLSKRPVLRFTAALFFLHNEFIVMKTLLHVFITNINETLLRGSSTGSNLDSVEAYLMKWFSGRENYFFVFTRF